MIRKGKKAEVVFCKRAETTVPVEAATKCPIVGSVRKGEENIRTVKCAVIHTAVKKQQERMCLVQQTGIYLQDRPAVVKRLAISKEASKPVRIESGQEKTASVKTVQCHTASKDITLKKLFHGWME